MVSAARAVTGAPDAPKKDLANALGRFLYLAHLGVLLWWLLDRNDEHRATKRLIGLIRGVLPAAALALRLPLLRGFVQSADSLFEEALLGTAKG